MVQFTKQKVVCLNKASDYKDFVIDIEKYARTCFQSEGSTGSKFVKRIMTNQHESVLEHFNLTFSITTSRSIANALVRHRHCAFTQESTHYIDYLKREIPFKFIKPIDKKIEALESIAIAQIENYQEAYELAGKNIARNYLPLGLKTQLIMTTNLREWRHILRLRGAFDHPQMLELITLLYNWFKENLSLFVEDINIKGIE